MSSYDQYRADVVALALEEFVQRHAHPFLLKRPEPHGPAERQVLSGFEMDEEATATISAEAVRAMLTSLNGERPTDPWLVLPLRRRARPASAATITFVRGTGLKHSAGFGRSVPLVVGRSAQSDAVLPYASISKTHAHVLLGVDGAVTVVDQGSRNGTFVNERRLAPGERAELRPGMALRLASLRFEFLCARRLYQALLAHAAA